jgi:hypothetical protein
MTVYVTDLDAYRGSLRARSAACWRARLGKHFPAMALVGVAGLVERRAKVEIEAIAHIPEERMSLSPKTFRFELERGVGTITLDRPRAAQLPHLRELHRARGSSSRSWSATPRCAPW